jgi:ankyrin repeat protein
MGEDDEAMRSVAENPRAACLADAFMTVCTLGKRERQTLLHLLCNGPDDTGGKVELAAILLDSGANIAARDDEYRSTPLAWAARANAAAMVEFLIARGAPTNLPDEEPWATSLAWADRRGHSQIASILRARGALR